jgi:hypothetical protein
MNKKALIGTFFIFISLLFEFITFSLLFPELLSSPLIIILIFLFTGFVTGLIFEEATRQAIGYFIFAGEALLVSFFVLLLLLVQDVQNQVSDDQGVETLGIVLILVIFLVIIFAGMIVFGVSGIIMFVAGSIAMNLKKNFDPKQKSNKIVYQAYQSNKFQKNGFCVNCGTKITNVRFCPSCGSPQ